MYQTERVNEVTPQTTADSEPTLLLDWFPELSLISGGVGHINLSIKRSQ